jgi:hypothetical protein
MPVPTAHKTTTVRLPADTARELEDLASFDGVAVAQEIREAIDLLIKERRNDPAFRDRVNAAVARSREMLERLDGGTMLADALDGQVEVAGSAAVAAATRR